MKHDDVEKEIAERERTGLLVQLENWLELPMIVLAFVWLILLVVEWGWGLNPFLYRAGLVIWVIFVVEFLLRFVVAPRKLHFLGRNWLTIIALAVPAFRVFRLVRVFRLARLARATRGLRLVRFVGSINRGVRALRRTLRARGFGYVLSLTLIVTFAAAAAMYEFERRAPDGGFDDFGTALWWTAMLMATMGTENWPETPEGRILSLAIAVYAFTVFGYVTATLASLFIGLDEEETKAKADESNQRQKQLRDEMEAVRSEIAALRAELARGGGASRDE